MIGMLHRAMDSTVFAGMNWMVGGVGWTPTSELLF